ncbi:MAG: bifunctional hydroxymethylpyrimidine kinase/phosphomethylpyrimidine kinase [Opitutales bacterium]
MLPASSNDRPAALTIAGSDSGGGAGIQADLRTFAAHGVHGTTVLTSLTAQNPEQVAAVEVCPAEFVQKQLSQVAGYFDVRALKTGMLADADIVRTVADFLKQHPDIPSVVDPVVVSTSGATLLEVDAIEAVRGALLPNASLITPNLDEAVVLLGEPIASESDMRAAARKLAETFATAVLLKGGHLGENRVIDVLQAPGADALVMQGTRIENVDTHGSGCTLSAAIAANLATGETLTNAVRAAHAYLRRCLEDPVRLKGRAFINHGPGRSH